MAFMRHTVQAVLFISVVMTSLSASAQMAMDQFEDISVEKGFGSSFYSWGSAWGDPNGDGKPDVFLTNHYRVKDNNVPYIFYQDDEFFVPDTLPQYDSVKDMHGSTWMDFDGDGDDDLYVVTGRTAGNLLLINDGAGNLSDQTDAWELRLSNARGRTPVWFDVNRDGLLDLFSTHGNPVLPEQRRNTLMIRDGDRFRSSVVDSMSFVGGVVGTGAMIGDPWGTGWTQLGMFSEKSIFWSIPGCLPLEEHYRRDVSFLEQVIAADFNGDGRTDLLAIRKRLTREWRRSTQPSPSWATR